jgi:hypothetical protein
MEFPLERSVGGFVNSTRAGWQVFFNRLLRGGGLSEKWIGMTSTNGFFLKRSERFVKLERPSR